LRSRWRAFVALQHGPDAGHGRLANAPDPKDPDPKLSAAQMNGLRALSPDNLPARRQT